MANTSEPFKKALRTRSVSLKPLSLCEASDYFVFTDVSEHLTCDSVSLFVVSINPCGHAS